MVKNSYPDKYSYFRYSVGFDVRGTFSLLNGSRFGKNVIMFEVDKSFFRYADNRKKDIFIISKGLTNGLDDTTSEAEYSINFSE